VGRRCVGKEPGPLRPCRSAPLLHCWRLPSLGCWAGGESRRRKVPPGSVPVAKSASRYSRCSGHLPHRTRPRWKASKAVWADGTCDPMLAPMASVLVAPLGVDKSHPPCLRRQRGADPRCGGRLRLLGTIDDAVAIRALLDILAVSIARHRRPCSSLPPRDSGLTHRSSADACGRPLWRCVSERGAHHGSAVTRLQSA